MERGPNLDRPLESAWLSKRIFEFGSSRHMGPCFRTLPQQQQHGCTGRWRLIPIPGRAVDRFRGLALSWRIGDILEGRAIWRILNSARKQRSSWYCLLLKEPSSNVTCGAPRASRSSETAANTAFVNSGRSRRCRKWRRVRAPDLRTRASSTRRQSISNTKPHTLSARGFCFAE